jgi:hypothetical protein
MRLGRACDGTVAERGDTLSGDRLVLIRARNTEREQPGGP